MSRQSKVEPCKRFICIGSRGTGAKCRQAIMFRLIVLVFAMCNQSGKKRTQKKIMIKFKYMWSTQFVMGASFLPLAAPSFTCGLFFLSFFLSFFFLFLTEQAGAGTSVVVIEWESSPYYCLQRGRLVVLLT